MQYAMQNALKGNLLQKRSYKRFNSQHSLVEIASTSWWEVFKCTKVDDAVIVLTQISCKILDREEMAPIKTFQMRQHYAPWLSEETKSVMADRDAAVSAARQSGNVEDLSVATKLRNKCTRLLRNEKHKYLQNKLASCENENDIAGIWKNVKGCLGWGGSAGAPT